MVYLPVSGIRIQKRDVVSEYEAMSVRAITVFFNKTCHLLDLPK